MVVDDSSRLVFSSSFLFPRPTARYRSMKFYEKEWRAKEAEKKRERERKSDQYRATVRKALFLRQ